MYEPLRTADPVADAERHAEDPRPLIDYCPVCKKGVYDEWRGYEKDDAYEMDEYVIHEECVIKYLNTHGYKL